MPFRLTRNADVAVSRAKESGGAKVEVYAAHLHADVLRRLELAGDLHRALNEGQLELHYEPVVELAGSRVAGAVALAVWRFGRVEARWGALTEPGDGLADER